MVRSVSLFGSLHTGVSGLGASQNSLNTTAHNIANAGTKGYVRQNVLHTDSRYATLGVNHLNVMQTGLGVNIAQVKQIRNEFLDRYFRNETGRQGFYESQRNTVMEVESLYGELEGVPFQNTLENFWASLQELSKMPDDIVTRATVVGNAFAFVERAEKIAQQLKEYQINLNTQITDQVKEINRIAKGIHDLNKQINFYESSGIEHANDLRDERNNLLDDLGKIIKITYNEHPNGKVTVSAESVALVLEDGYFQMGTMQIDASTPMLKPVWPHLNNTDVLNLDVAPSTSLDTDIGTLKGLLLSRGSKEANYTDIPVKNGDPDPTYDARVRAYNNTVGASVIMTVQAQFDQLIHGIVTKINDLLAPNKTESFSSMTVTMADGTTAILDGDYEILDLDKAPRGMDENHTVGEALFNRKGMERYTQVKDAAGNTIYLYNKEGHTRKLEDIGPGDKKIVYEADPANKYSLYSVGEIEINSRILNNYSILPLSSNQSDGGVDQKVVEDIISLWNEPFATLSPNTYVKNKFKDYYQSFIDDLAVRGQKFEAMADHQQAMTDGIDNERQRVMGVSTEEELTNLIKFQHAYNASARYITVIDRMLEHLISRLG